MKKAQLAQLFRGTSGRWPAHIISPVGPRGEGAVETPAEPATPTIDATNPAVQALITAALAAHKTSAEEEKQKIIANRDAILAEKKATAETAAKLQADLDSIKTRAKAAEHAVDPEKYNADVNAAADQKVATIAEENKLVLADRETKLRAAEVRIQELEASNRRAWAESTLIQATIPVGEQMVHPGAWNNLVEIFSGVIEPRKVDGVEGDVTRVVVNGAILPTMGLAPSPDGMMTPQELMVATRQGKGPLAKYAYLFVSKGQGSDTKAPDGSSAGSGVKWDQLTDAQKSQIWGEDPKRAQQLVDAQMEEKRKAASQRRAA